jgi:hypothetical protein
MRTIELDTSNPVAFENYVSIRERKNEKIILSIIVITVISYFIYDYYQDSLRKRNE